MKRVSLIALATILIATLGIAEPLGAASHAAGKKGKTQHTTVSNTNVILIPDVSPATPYPSEIEVTGFKKAKISDVDVVLRAFNHGNTADVHVLLVAPNGDNAIIMGAAGGIFNAVNLSIELDDEASDPLPNLGPLIGGAYRPAEYGSASFNGAPAQSGETALSTFDGGNPNGAWRLFVVDNIMGNVGAFSGGWDLKITAKGKSKHHGHHKH